MADFLILEEIKEEDPLFDKKENQEEPPKKVSKTGGKSTKIALRTVREKEENQLNRYQVLLLQKMKIYNIHVEAAANIEVSLRLMKSISNGNYNEVKKEFARLISMNLSLPMHDSLLEMMNDPSILWHEAQLRDVKLPLRLLPINIRQSDLAIIVADPLEIYRSLHYPELANKLSPNLTGIYVFSKLSTKLQTSLKRQARFCGAITRRQETSQKGGVATTDIAGAQNTDG